MTATENGTVHCPSCNVEAFKVGQRGGTRGQALTHTYYRCSTDDCKDHGSPISKDMRTGEISFGLPSFA